MIELVDVRLDRPGGGEPLVTGANLKVTRGEVVMIPGKPKLAFDKLILFGAGPRSTFDVPAFTEMVRAVLRALTRLRVRTAVVELPGRVDGLIDASTATDVVLGESESAVECDAWILVEDVEARAAIEQCAAERRRRRRVLAE